MSTPARSDPNAVLNDIARAIKGTSDGVPTDVPFRLGKVYSVNATDSTNGPGRPYLLVWTNEDDVITREMRFAGDIWDYRQGDTVAWINWNGAPLVLGRMPNTGTEWDPNEGGDPWHYVGASGEPTYNAGWGPHANTDYSSPRFRKQSDGWVQLSGLAVGGTGVAFTLPETHWAASQYEFIVCSGNQTAAVVRVDQFGQVQLMVGSAGTFISLDGVSFPTGLAPNMSAWRSISLRNDWIRQDAISSTLSTPYEIVEFFTREDGWHWMKGRIATGPASVTLAHDLGTLPYGTTLNGFCQSLPGFANASSAARLDFGGSSSGGNRKDDVIVYSNHFFAGNGDVRLGGLNWFGQTGINNPWVFISFSNGWTQYNEDWSRCRYYVDPHGVVHLRGMVKASSATSDTVCAAGFFSGTRLPDKKIVLLGMGDDNYQRIDVYPDGSLVAPARPASWLSLSGAHWVGSVDT